MDITEIASVAKKVGPRNILHFMPIMYIAGCPEVENSCLHLIRMNVPDDDSREGWTHIGSGAFTRHGNRDVGKGRDLNGKERSRRELRHGTLRLIGRWGRTRGFFSW